MKNLLLIIVFFIETSICLAQPGYLGKKLSLSYNLNGSPLFSGVSYSYKGEEESLFKLDYNLIQSVRLDKIYSRKHSYGFQFGYFRTGLYDVNFNYNQVALFKLHSFQYGMNFRKYFDEDGCLAPFGGYSEFGFGVHQQFVYDSYLEDYFTSRFVPYINIAWGTQRIYFDKLLFDISFKVSFYPQILTEKILSYHEFENLSPNDRIISLQNNGILRTQMLDMFTLKIGFGTLL